MTPQSNMRPPMATPAPAQGGPAGFTPEDIAQIAQETGYAPERIMADIQRTGATDKQSLYPTFYGGLGVEPASQPMDQVAGAGMPVMAAPENPQEEAMEPPQSPGQEAAEGEGLPPEAVQAMRASMSKTAPEYRRRQPPPRMHRG